MQNCKPAQCSVDVHLQIAAIILSSLGEKDANTVGVKNGKQKVSFPSFSALTLHYRKAAGSRRQRGRVVRAVGQLGFLTLLLKFN